MSSQLARSEESAVPGGSRVAAGAGLGVFAAVIGYLLTYLLISGEVRETISESVAEWKAVAWYFYNAHMVDIQSSGSFGPFGGTGTVNFITESSSSTAGVLYILPPLALLAVGAFLALRWNATDLGEAIIAGTPVTIGYGLVMGVGAIVTESSAEWSTFGIEGSSSTAPVLVPAVLLGGIIYPLVFSNAGAVIATAINGR
ncbi:hypothetical protein [Natrinema salaciae]|uniref:DUF7978 domain-containing protein n=1 Tax=Natrinema salaciae TaxID=1186196 RepID=A0A1H9I3R7_9EURY|nr:hypothetical protein [Natrinema salaciae]SEQ69203.1 hypothetical protein SAMN04489841_2099 [Natrinema salaciae]